MPESYQDRLKRVRPPRVQIDCKVDTGGAMEVIELPFVVGVMADLSGMAKEEDKKPFKHRRFVPIDRDNFNKVLAQSAPRLAFRVADKVSGQEDQQLNVELNFRSMDDFEPAKIAAQVPVLNDLLKMREKLNELLAKMEGNDALEKLLSDVLSNTEKQQELAKVLGTGKEESGESGNGEEKAEGEEKSE